jgi:uncharacterized protein YvpB
MDISLFPGSANEYKTWIERKTMNILPVPYVSQIQPGALQHANDCGAASTLMVLNAYQIGLNQTVDQVYNQIQPSGDVALSAGGLQAILSLNQIRNEWRADLRIHDLYDILVSRCPVIALIHYAPLVKAGLTERTGFLGAHFVVVVGMDIQSICIHDPYTTRGGEALAVPIAVFEQAWAQCSLDGNPEHAAIIVTMPIQDLSNPVSQPSSVKYEFAIYDGRLVNGINVRSGPASTYLFIRSIWRAETPFVYISKISGDWGQLTDGSGWVYLPYLKKE